MLTATALEDPLLVDSARYCCVVYYGSIYIYIHIYIYIYIYIHIRIYTGWWFQPPLKNISQIGSSSQLFGKIKNVPNYQPVCVYIYISYIYIYIIYIYICAYQIDHFTCICSCERKWDIDGIGPTIYNIWVCLETRYTGILQKRLPGIYMYIYVHIYIW